jgi:hypothetical protein
LALTAVGLVLLGAACASSDAAFGSEQPHRGPSKADIAAKALMIVVNPSARARSLAFEHANQIVQTVASINLTLIGLYEQPTGVRKPPFNRPFVVDRTTSGKGAPTPPPPVDCSKYDTEYKRKKCQREYDDAVKRFNKQLDEWKRQTAKAVELWKGKVGRKLSELGRSGPTEEAANNDWDIRGAFLEVGQNIRAFRAPTNCVVLLGGVAVRKPPEHLRADLLAKATVIISGWTGTQKVQDQWSKRLFRAGAHVTFLTPAATELDLGPRVGSCLRGAPA